MKGRLHAALLALLGIPLLSTATVGLITLRLGHRQGTLILLIALIPTLIGVAMGRMPALLLWLSLISVFSVFAYSVLLRATVSWVFTLLGACALMVLVTPLLAWQFDSLVESFSRVMASPQALLGEGSEGLSSEGLSNEPVMSDSKPVPLQSVALVSGIVALLTMVNGFSSLVLARWWQSLLYNPGGFGDEFQAIRLTISPAVVLAVLAAVCFLGGRDFVFWLLVFLSPLAIAALALAHFVAKAKGLGVSWLASLYLLTVFFLMPMIAVLALIGLLDAVLNFRERLAS